MLRQDLERMSREQLIAEAERLGIPRPRVLTLPELIDEIIGRTAKSERERAKARGWLGRARDLLSRVVERGLHLPEAARVLRREGREGDDRGWPAPPPPLPTVTLAEIYAAQGHLERALAVLDEVLAREPDHREARQMRERFLEQAQRSRARKAGEKDAPPSSKGARAKEPAAKEPVAKEPAAKEPAAKEPAAKEPAANAEEAAAPSVPVRANAEEAAAPSVPVRANAEEAAAPSVPVRANAEEAAAPSIFVSANKNEGAEPSADLSASDEEGAEPSADLSASDEEGLEASPEAEDLGEASTERAPHVEEAVEEAAEALEEPPLPERYEVDEIVAIAVDPRTIYLYWEVKPTTLAHAQAEQPEGFLCVRVVSVIATWEGPRRAARDLRVDALYGDRFLRDIQPGSNVRVSVGWRGAAGFYPFAIGAEVTAPRMVPVESVAQEVARFEADPVVAPFQHRTPQPAFAPVLVEVHEALTALPPALRAAAAAPISVEQVIATRGHGAPVDTGVESFADEEAGEEGEAAPSAASAAPEEIVASVWTLRGGSSELSRVPVRTVKRRELNLGSFGGASELSR